MAQPFRCGVGYTFYDLEFVDGPVDGRPAVCLDYGEDNLPCCATCTAKSTCWARARCCPHVEAQVRLAPGPILAR